jgi:phosphatidate cytidylyltransferase
MSADWSDLKPRVLSALAMVALGGGALWYGGLVFAELVTVATGIMIWELAQMTRREGSLPSWALGLLACVVLTAVVVTQSPYALVGLIVPPLLGALTPRRDRAIFASYAMVIIGSGIALIALRHWVGLSAVLWLLSVVVVSDIMGYFAGRMLGGPKFWPRISPKKTWSGTVAGWIGAALVGWAFWANGVGSSALIWFSPLVAFAGQLGDIAESAIKRRAGVKDSSQLIPGHGGLLDRFDALSFASILVGLPLWIGMALAFIPQAAP